MPVLRGDAVEKRPAIPAEMTTLYTQEALRFIEAHRHSPFFLYIGHAMPHLPFDASEEFKARSARGLYGDVVEELDDSTGRILDKLRALGLAEKTLVIFTSDNGPERRTPGSAAPLSGTKHTVHEGGLRVPCIAWWPRHVSRGRVCDEFLVTLDVLPTLAQLVGAHVASVDGIDFAPLLRGENGARSLRTTLYSLYGYGDRRLESMREGRWKLHLASPPQLFDLETDLSETTDVSTQHPDIVQRLSREARRINTETVQGDH
jgi:arylsulfatase